VSDRSNAEDSLARAAGFGEGPAESICGRGEWTADDYMPICRLMAVAPISTARSRPALPR
jgi:hypothetical protein